MEAVDPPRRSLSMTMNPKTTRIANVAPSRVVDVVVAIRETEDDLLRTLVELILTSTYSSNIYDGLVCFT
jgi:hypothetical protein